MLSEFMTSTQFYSWYIYPENDEDLGETVSSAEFIEDVNQVLSRTPLYFSFADQV
jgi:hypothetical protein